MYYRPRHVPLIKHDLAQAPLPLGLPAGGSGHGIARKKTDT